MSENNNLTYYQKNWNVILNRAKDYYENDKKRLRWGKQEINTETYLNKKKIKKEDILKIDITICLKKWNKD